VPDPRDGTPPGPAPAIQPRDETLDAEPDRPCQVCEQPVAAAATGRPRSYCSRACQARAYRARKQAGLAEDPAPTLPQAPLRPGIRLRAAVAASTRRERLIKRRTRPQAMTPAAG
jgi:hypothetical protein